MADYTRLDGLAPVTSVTSRIWEIQKKRKTEDRQRQKEKDSEKKKKEEDHRQLPPMGTGVDPVNDTADTHEMDDYGSAKPLAKTIHKIDVKI